MALMLLLSSVRGWGQTTIISENIQSWPNQGSYGNYTQSITIVGVGTGDVTMNDCIVANAASATGTCSAGRVQLKASTGVLKLPEVASISLVEFHIAAGGAGRTVKLQKFNGSTWDDLQTFTGIGTTGATFTYNMNSTIAAIIRLSSAS